MTSSVTEDTRSFFQARLALLHCVGFSISAVFLVGVVVVRGLVGGEGLAELRQPSRWCHIAATLLTLALWRVLARRKISYRGLEVLDAAGLLALSLLLDLNGGLFHIRTVAVFNLALTTGVALVLRAVIIPSSARRTLAITCAASALAIAVFFLSALHPSWPVRQTGLPDWPLPFQLISLVLWLAALGTTATVASAVIYRMRGEVRAARQLGQYVLGDKLGEGGMGVVYRATHARLRRETALKLLPPDRIDPRSLERFEREVVQTARLRHPNTVAIFDYGRTIDGVFYYAMEYLDGVTIGELVDEAGPLPPGRVIALLAQVCASLEEAHEHGLVHRDIKPANIMVVGHAGAFDLVKVLDFGLVKTMSSTPSAASLTTDQQVIGTPLYMSPESVLNPDEVDGRSDLYAVAAIGYFMLSGEHVFDGASPVEICAAHLHLAPRPISERLGRAIPRDLEALILQTLAKEPGDRPASAAALREALLACDVPRWSEDDARSWWRERGSRSGPRVDASPQPNPSPPAAVLSVQRPVA
jgi:serine/threonine-protein kinase